MREVNLLAKLPRGKRNVNAWADTVLRRTTATVTIREERIGPLTVEP